MADVVLLQDLKQLPIVEMSMPTTYSTLGQADRGRSSASPGVGSLPIATPPAIPRSEADDPSADSKETTGIVSVKFAYTRTDIHVWRWCRRLIIGDP